MIAALSIFPAGASNHAGSIDAIFWTLVLLCGLVTFGLVAAIVFACIRYRAGSSAVRQAHQGTSMWLEISWTSATFLAFLAIFIWSGFTYLRVRQTPANATEVQVVGQQWMWKIQHTDGRREINQLHLLVGQPVKLMMTSQDVIHDFFIPAFRTKQDVVPGRYTTESFTPTRPGSYHLYCAEYCGMDHSKMGGWIHVLEPAAYARWLADAAAGESVLAAGQRLFTARGCSGCHAPNSAVHAPLLDGIYNHPVPLSDGSVVMADDQYLHDSILLPNKQIAAGYQPLMPAYQGQLSEEDVLQLVSYIKSLGTPR